jgi:hypothetical protein
VHRPADSDRGRRRQQPQMSFINVQPAETITFVKPFNEGAKDVIRITNTLSPSNDSNYIGKYRVQYTEFARKKTNHGPAFKVKTTAPKSYSVRPNSGKLAPGESCEIVVQLQPLETDPVPGERSKDKFLIQAIRTPRAIYDMADTDQYAQLMHDQWNRAEGFKKTEPNFMTEKKLRVQYTNPGELSKPDFKAYDYQASRQMDYQGVPVRQVNLGQQDALQQISQLKSTIASTEDNLRTLDTSLRQRNVHNPDALIAGVGASPSKHGAAGSSQIYLSPKKQGDVKDVIVAQLWRVGEMRIKVKFAALLALAAFLLGVLFF